MAIEDIQRHHRRFLKVSDKFKALWTFHQMLQAIYRHYFDRPLPYSIQFKELYDTIRGLPPLFQGLPPAALEKRFEEIHKSVEENFNTVQDADSRIEPSHIRQFFEQRLNVDDQDKILYQIIKFYLYGQKIDGNIRDKLDYLITHLSSQYSESEKKFILRDRNHLKEIFEKLMAVGDFPEVDSQLKSEYISLLQELRQEVLTCKSLEDFVLSGILKAIRGLKARMGGAFLHPDILLKVAELNVATKNQYTEIYRKEEKNLLEDTTRIKRMTESGIISSPDLMEKVSEIERLQSVLFAGSQQREVKIEHLAEFKNNVKRILEELDTKFTFDLSEDLVPPAPYHPEPSDSYDEEAAIATLCLLGRDQKMATGFFLEEFEFQALKAYELLHNLELLQEKDRLILKGAIVRYHIDLYVADLLEARKKQAIVDKHLMGKTQMIIDRGQDLEKQIVWLLDEALFQGNSSEVQVLSRAKYRLARSLSGLWLLYDSLANEVHKA
ncbi:MAG TPA: hypothetical protein PK014_11280 [Thermoanaerobaculia bacterium]|nr:hypothetical protein [Thermoanaerobaculia bacterium]HUM30704.1 hypothetical protein [Thermoanaerobaculia bacterium]HXK68888.1 hypothetical protein [Thermoanaerobaculia bacterium]